MSIWQWLKASLAALSRGEGLGAVFDRLQAEPERSVGFTIAVIALGAKMAKADGLVTRDEIAAFREVFHVPAEAEAEAARVYNLARQDVAGFEVYASRVAAMFEDRPEVLADLLEGLCHVAAADGDFHPAEAAFLAEVARLFGLDDDTFRAIRARQIPGERDPWAVLGLAPGTDAGTLRRRYRALVRDLHPDAMVARGTPAEAARLAEKRLAAVNAAYAELTDGREAAHRSGAPSRSDAPAAR
ncbi:MAG: TerB family tellurite resistance protein [Paracoccaceae bacterium]